MKKTTRMFVVLIAAVACTVVSANSAKAQITTSGCNSPIGLVNFADCGECTCGAEATARARSAQRGIDELATEVERTRGAIASARKAAAEADSKMKMEYEAAITALEARVKKLEEELTAGCQSMKEGPQQMKCLEILEGIYSKTGKVLDVAANNVNGKRCVEYSYYVGKSAQTPGAYLEVRCPDEPIPIPTFEGGEPVGGNGVSTVVKYVVIPLAGGLLGGAIAGWAYPDGPNEDGNFEFGSVPKGAGIGIGAGYLVGVGIDLLDD